MTTPLPKTSESVRATAALFRGLVHGDDANGVWDISFPDLGQAAAFADVWNEQGAMVRLRDVVSRFNVPVVVQLDMKGEPEPTRPFRLR